MTTRDTLRRLQSGTLELEGLLPWSSNYTFLVQACDEQGGIMAVYKPRRGERPLWDFARGTLCLREVAAFIVSDALGWDLVPPTALREGPHGLGSVQAFIEHDPDRHYFTFEGDVTYRQPLQQVVLLDMLINNADRKAGHVLIEKNHLAPDDRERVWGIDHGVCFHTEYKLRTVIWEFASESLPPDLHADLVALQARLADNADDLSDRLGELLTNREIQAFRRRLSQLIARPVFPEPGPGRHYPWPPV